MGTVFKMRSSQVLQVRRCEVGRLESAERADVRASFFCRKHFLIGSAVFP